MKTINAKSALSHVEIATQESAIECRDAMGDTGWSWGNGESVTGLEREAIEAMAEGYEEFEIEDAEMEAEAEGRPWMNDHLDLQPGSRAVLEREAVEAMAEGYEEFENDDAEMEAEAEVNGL